MMGPLSPRLSVTSNDCHWQEKLLLKNNQENATPILALQVEDQPKQSRQWQKFRSISVQVLLVTHYLAAQHFKSRVLSLLGEFLSQSLSQPLRAFYYSLCGVLRQKNFSNIGNLGKSGSLVSKIHYRIIVTTLLILPHIKCKQLQVFCSIEQHLKDVYKFKALDS